MSVETTVPDSPRPVRAAAAASPPAALPRFLAGDVILFAVQGDIFGRIARWVLRGPGEGPTYAVHSAQFLDGARYVEMNVKAYVRATPEILKPHQPHDMGRRRGFTVWRLRALTPAQRAALGREAARFAGAGFGMAKSFTLFLDSLLTKATRHEIIAFRRLSHDPRHPLCSGITGYSYDRALGYRFGVPPEAADPDQIDDWVQGHPAEWECVYRLEDYAQVPVPPQARWGGARAARPARAPRP